MTIINEFTLGDSTAQFSEYVSLLFYLAKKAEPTVHARMAKVAQLTEAYYECRGDKPAPAQLDRLASLVLRDELTDSTPWKTQNTEYPIESDHKAKRYYDGVTSFMRASTVATDGKDYRVPVRKTS